MSVTVADGKVTRGDKTHTAHDQTIILWRAWYIPGYGYVYMYVDADAAIQVDLGLLHSTTDNVEQNRESRSVECKVRCTGYRRKRIGYVNVNR